MNRILTAILLLTAVGCGPQQLEGVFPIKATRASHSGACDGAGVDPFTTTLQFINGNMQPILGDDATCYTSYDKVNGGMGEVEVNCIRSPGGFTLTEFNLFVRTENNKMKINTGMVISTGNVSGCTRISYTLIAL